MFYVTVTGGKVDIKSKEKESCFLSMVKAVLAKLICKLYSFYCRKRRVLYRDADSADSQILRLIP